MIKSVILAPRPAEPASRLRALVPELLSEEASVSHTQVESGSCCSLGRRV